VRVHSQMRHFLAQDYKPAARETWTGYFFTERGKDSHHESSNGQESQRARFLLTMQD